MRKAFIQISKTDPKTSHQGPGQWQSSRRFCGPIEIGLKAVLGGMSCHCVIVIPKDDCERLNALQVPMHDMMDGCGGAVQ